MAGTIANVIVDAAQIYVGTAGAYPTSDPGYTESGVDFTYDASVTEVVVHEETVPIGANIESEKIGVSFVMADNIQKRLQVVNGMIGSEFLVQKIHQFFGVALLLINFQQ